MHRLRGSVVIGALAVAVGAVAAGPAFAAKGGNSDNAHACQQGGHENRFEAETGRPFKNAGDCVSHGAQGGTSGSLVIDPGTYACGGSATGTCWGTVSGSELLGPWFVVDDNGDTVASGEANGTLSQNLELECAAVPGISSVQAFAHTSAGTVVKTPFVDKPTTCG
jgi:hypothetical protein